MRSLKLEKKSSEDKPKEVFNEQKEIKKLYFGAAAAVIGLFIFAILFYIGIFTLIFNSYKLHKETKKASYLLLSIFAGITFVILEAVFNT